MNEELDLKEINVVSVIMTLSYARKFYFLETYTEALGVKWLEILWISFKILQKKVGGE